MGRRVNYAKYLKEWKRRNPEKVKAYGKTYARKHAAKIRVRSKKHYEKNKAKVIARSTARNRQAYKLDSRPYIARAALYVAVKLGKIKRPKACERCGTSKHRIEGHHHKGYSKEFELDVQWLCPSCHRYADQLLEH